MKDAKAAYIVRGVDFRAKVDVFEQCARHFKSKTNRRDKRERGWDDRFGAVQRETAMKASLAQHMG